MKITFFLLLSFLSLSEFNAEETRNLLSARRKLLNGVQFLNVVTTGKCNNQIYDSTNPQTDIASYYASSETMCNQISSALRAENNQYTSISNRRRPGPGCYWRGSATGDLQYNQRSGNTKDCTNDNQCLCLQPCNAGTFGITTEQMCQPCATGRVSSVAGHFGQCNDECIAGQYQDQTGQTSCKICPIGFYQNLLGKDACKSCSAGYYNNENGKVSAMDCKGCSVGFYQNLPSSSDCKNCIAGQFTDIADQIACKTCTVGKYQNEVSKEACKSCPSGRYNTDQLKIVEEHDSLEDCKLCEDGQYLASTGQSGCNHCDPGQYENEMGQVACKECLPGTHNQNSNGKDISECKACVAGTYADQAGLVNCKNCVAGLYGVQTGASGVDTCLFCAAGYFSTYSGSDACLPCALGMYMSDSLRLETPPKTTCFSCPTATTEASTTCEGCDAGKFGEMGAGGCQDCAVGFYASGGDVVECTACPKGYHGSDLAAQAQCKSCISGKFSDSVGTKDGSDICTAACGESSCKSCGVGKFSAQIAGTSDAVCVACAAGTYSKTEAAGHISFCRDCEPGRFSESQGRSTDCDLCVAGKFKQSAGSTNPCTECPKGWSQIDPGISSCNLCLPGQAQNSIGSTECTNCIPGKYSPIPKEDLCSDCPQGTYQSEEGRASCLPCIPGRTAVSETSTECTKCTKGTYQSQSASTTNCKNCPEGYLQPSSGQPSCLNCSVGYYQDQEASFNCIPCEFDTYSARSGNGKQCDLCPQGFESAKASSACTLCPAGRSGTPCTDCAKGKYRDGASSPTACIDCPLGFYQGVEGSASCMACTPGLYQDEMSTFACKMCNVGAFSNASEFFECYMCSYGKYQDVKGQASCLPCIPGRFNNQLNQTSCKMCPVNTFTNAIMSETCENCETGQVTFNKIGQASCSNCFAGTFGSGDKCEKCMQGQFRAAGDPDPLSCDICPPGSHSSEKGMTNCMPCSPGTFNNAYGQSKCKVCKLGKYSLEPNATTCKFCSKGSGTARNGSSFCTECPKGKYSNIDTGYSCTVCRIGLFNDVEGNDNCMNCESGKYALVVESVICEAAKASPDDVLAVESVSMKQVLNNPYQINLFWEHNSKEPPEGKGVANEFFIQWSTSREFAAGSEMGNFQVKDGIIRNQIITISKKEPIEIYLLNKPIFIRIKTIKNILLEETYIPTASNPSISTLPWKLAVECNDDEYLNSTSMDPLLWKCDDCPRGAYCRGPTTWNDVRPIKGYWRVPWKLDQFERCPYVGDCSGVDPDDPRRRIFGSNGTEKNASKTDGCIYGTEGVLCSRCTEGFNRDANICTKCEQGSLGIRIAIVIVLFVFLLAVFLAVRKKLKKAWRKYRSLYRDVLRIVSIFVTFSQINTSMPSIIEVKWPQFFVDFVSNFNVVNIDLFSVIGVSCVGNFNFYMSFCAMLSLPTAIALYVIITLYSSIKSMNSTVAKLSKQDKMLKQVEAYHALYHLIDDDGGGSVSPSEFCVLFAMLGWEINVDQSEAVILAMNKGNPSRKYRDERGRVCLKEDVFVDHMVSSKLEAMCEKVGGSRKKKKDGVLHNSDEILKWVLKRGIVSRVMAGATSLLLLSHTPVSRKVFQFFHCHKLGHRQFLRADYTIECGSDNWFKFLPLVLAVLGAFTLALPGSISYYLWKNRDKLYSASISQKIGWLYEPFVKGAEFWQVHDVILKMILTGMLIYITPSFRATTAAMITVISIVNLNFFEPQKNRTLFWLSQCSFIITCFKYLTALMIGAAGSNHPQEWMFGYMLVSLDIFFIVTAIVACGVTVIIIKNKIKNINKVRNRIKNSMHRSLALLPGSKSSGKNEKKSKVYPSKLFPSKVTPSNGEIQNSKLEDQKNEDTDLKEIFNQQKNNDEIKTSKETPESRRMHTYDDMNSYNGGKGTGTDGTVKGTLEI